MLPEHSMFETIYLAQDRTDAVILLVTFTRSMYKNHLNQRCYILKNYVAPLNCIHSS